ncbi:hypothetical protein N7468_010558 [Penicillium chermesinum]|uniref:Uncharacterized protein n=1 Tax=Penicillium chermesinum TaxID=63820 RepID=A0A9W9TA53_9EURO|nr:uncharacterized protein N7468_010558 [Penicillium chermesinum]KAJ5214879.1 hypothetical protein N7468_010558 [Penicillium chermesinum]KAJ6141618.1 hypothetical protein N7470_010008 [Penicillium chermesinum]
MSDNQGTYSGHGHDHEGFFERILDHKHHGSTNYQQSHPEKTHEGHANEQSQSQPHEESEMDKFKDYWKKDKQLEEEGDEYGGLM